MIKEEENAAIESNKGQSVVQGAAPSTKRSKKSQQQIDNLKSQIFTIQDSQKKQ